MIEQNKKHRVLKNLFFITTIGGILATFIANRTESELVGWFSYRDEILDMEKLFAIDMFHISFIQYLDSSIKCQFVAAPATSTSQEWYGELVKVPLSRSYFEVCQKTSSIIVPSPCIQNCIFLQSSAMMNLSPLKSVL